MSGFDSDIWPPRDSLDDQRLQNLGLLGRAAYAVGLQNHRSILHDAATRTKHGYAALAKAAGFEPPKGSDDEMGDLTVTGDQTYHIQQAPQQQKGVPGWLAALLTAGALAAGVAGSQLMDGGEEPPPAVAPDDGGGIGYSLEIR